MDKRFRKLKWNSTLAIMYQIVLIITGLIMPRLYLKFYGSNVYGLTSSITQFLAFINICDMGISAVVSSALYEPLAKRNMLAVSRVIVFARRFFELIGFILCIYVIGLIVIYPSIVANTFSRTYTVTLLLAMSVSQFGQYFIGITNQIIINADQRSYIQLMINGATLILNTVISIVLIYCGISIQLVKLTSSLIYLARPLCMRAYVKSHYNIDYKLPPRGDAIPQKLNGVIQHIAYMVYQNAGIAVLTIFSSISNVSVYSVYVLVLNSLNNFINAATTGIQALFGNMIALNEKEKLKLTYDYYDWLVHTVSTLLFTLASILIVPFVLIYTNDISDANYNVPLFAVFITIAYAFDVIRNCIYVIIRAAGHYKQVQVGSIIEAVLNLGISIPLVIKFGLVGVAIGRLIAVLYFTMYQVHYLSRNIIYRKTELFVKQICVDLLGILGIITLSRFFNVDSRSYMMWIWTSFRLGCLSFCFIMALQRLFYLDNFNVIKQKIYNALHK